MAAKRRKNPGGDGMINLLITGGALIAIYYWLQSNCASASPLSTSLCSTLFGSTAAASTSTVETNCLASFSAAVLAAAGGNQTLANSAMNALTATDLTAIQTSCVAGTVPAIPASAQAVITAGLASGSSSSGGSGVMSSGGTSLAIPSSLTVTPVINGGLQGTVNVNGDPVSLAVITSRAGQSSGVVYNASGSDVTSLFTAAQVQSLVSAFQLAPQTSSGVSGLGYRGISAAVLHSAY